MNAHTNLDTTNPEATNTHCAGSVEPMQRPDHKAKRHPRPKNKYRYNRGPRNPKKARKGEVIGGGFFVFRRGDGTKRIRPSMWPFEHGSFASALAEAARLREATGDDYQVFTSLLPAEPLVLSADNDDWDFDPRTAETRQVTG